MKIPKHAKKVFSGIIYDIYHWEDKDLQGNPFTWEGIKRRPSVQLFIKTNDNKWIVTSEKRPGNHTFQGLPGGQIEDGESHIEAAKRELLEELGMTGNFKYLGVNYVPIPKTEWCGHYYLVTDPKKIQEPQFDSSEEVIPIYLDFQTYKEKLNEEKFGNRQAKLFLNRLE